MTAPPTPDPVRSRPEGLRTEGLRTEGPRTDGLRTDVQALRAVAVGLVLVFHLFPDQLTGGYVGVDVFFVISGFLITSHLVARPPRGAGDLAQFWARRVRRLLPASLAVLASTLVASRLLAPETQWENTAQQVRASALYFVNWLLASDAVDYLAADDAPSPVQHFWSLAVEEQFYLGWPVLLLVLGALGSLPALRRHRRLVLGSGLAAVVAASLVWSVHLTAADPARAYFVTPTRIWELGVGGVLAWLVAGPRWRPPRAAFLLAGAGLVAIVVAAAKFDGSTPFPGWSALLPVLGAAAVIGAEAPSTGVLGRALAVRPVQWLGDVSYAVYLWHWPLIVLLPEVSGGSLGLLDKAAVLVATLVLAGLTKRFVEDPFRTRRWQARLGPTYALGGAAMAVVVGLSVAQVVETDRRAEDARTEVADRFADPCFGAGALVSGTSCPETTGDPVPAPVLAAKDKSAAYKAVGGRDCWSESPAFEPVSCDFGVRDSTVRIALVGNSHAGHWLPALEEAAAENDWRIDTFLASQCAWSDLRQQFASPAHATACRAWVDRTTTAVAEGDYDLVVTSNRISVPAEGRSLEESRHLYRAGYRTVLAALAEAGVPVLAIRDTPAPGDAGLHSVPDCIAAHDDPAACSAPRADWEPDDPVVEAVGEIGDPRVRVADLNDLVCGPERCRAVVGGAVVYFDGSHLTATYARTLAPFLEAEVAAALD